MEHPDVADRPARANPESSGPVATPSDPASATTGADPYDLAVWFENAPITAARARSSYLALAAEQLEAGDPSAVANFADKLLSCFPEVSADALPPVPGSRNASIAAIRGECYVYEAGVYFSFAAELAPDLTPLVTHLADLHGLVVYDRQRQGVFLPSSIESPSKLRITAGDGFVVAHDPTAAEIPDLLDAAEASQWFRIIERDADHFLQAAPAAPGPDGVPDHTWIVEYRDGDDPRHFQATGARLEQVKQAFVLYAVGGNRWKDLFAWSPLRS